MRALVTGGAGFIGSHLCEALFDAGWDVAFIDDCSTGKWLNIPFEKNCKMDCYYNDILGLHPDTVDRLVSGADVVFHLAATVGVERVQHQPLAATQQNMLATQKMLSCAAKHHKPILIASSSEVYGRRPDDQALREEMDLHIGTELRWGYAAAKMADEFTALAHHAESGLPVVVARLFNTVGPKQVGTYGMVMPRMIEAAVAGQPIHVIGGGQRRSFAWVTEVVDCLVRLIQAPAAYGQVVNVGSQNDISIRTLGIFVQREVAKFGIHQPPIQYSPYRSDWADIMFRKPDLSKLQFLIGRSPTMPITDMIERLVTDKMSRLTANIP
jgi:UDP-glucose 4-epimerase